MKKSALLFLVTTLVLFSSCLELGKSVVNNLGSDPTSTSESNYKTVSVDSLYQIDLPYYMKAATQLHPESTFQYANIFKEAYFVLIQENKYEYIEAFKQFGEYNSQLPVIENYKNAQESMFKENILNTRIQEYGLKKINGKPARQLKVFGEVDGIKAAYIVAFVEGENDIFMLMNWTLEDRIDKFENSFEYINGSFKLID